MAAPRQFSFCGVYLGGLDDAVGYAVDFGSGKFWEGWPLPRAFAAAAGLHVAFIAVSLIGWRSPVPLPAPAPEFMRVSLAPSSPEPPDPPATLPDIGVSTAAAESTPPPEAAAPEAAAPGEGVPFEINTPAPEARPPAPTLKSERAPAPRPRAKPPAEARRASKPAPDHADSQSLETKNLPAGAEGQSQAGVAVYSVTAEATGTIRNVTIVQSSGTTALDQKGEEVIRSSMDFRSTEPTAPLGPTVFSVAIRFSPEPR